MATYVAAAAAGALLATGGWALAASGGKSVHACASKRSGVLRLSSDCHKRERAVSWSVQGPRGARGVRGLTGAQGPQGQPGQPGTPGASATKLWAYVNDDGNLTKSTGGATASGQTLQKSLGTIQQTITFPTSLDGCVAIASASNDEGVETPIEPMEASISGATVTVNQTNSGSNVMLPFAVVVFC